MPADQGPIESTGKGGSITLGLSRDREQAGPGRVVGTGQEGMQSPVRHLKTRLGTDEEVERFRRHVEVSGTVEETPAASRSLTLEEGIWSVAQRIRELVGSSSSGWT